MIDGAIAQSRAAAAAVDQKTQGSIQKALATPVTAQVAVNTEALKAVVAGTGEGEAFRNAIARGADPRQDGVKAAEETADNTGEMVDQLDELNSSLSSSGGFGLASISV
jgi:hypothetical protein